ncbi:SusD/RagB family nutrient-binding outer membrane lipoprotein [Spirosoma endbachense]|uniref:SusD/RagB family nutrient-binding outer membrane lipoprotein n=1 Tax=Spirosoma endbachense TaxID=2666025 RepID=A0A6P1VWP8_9BACT|nr:SusD/RagB family nutrient-binding outer membrane lipoprotein [Spirosoma endbachense]QHV95796.1 SusD/RagB family nutrient-binding outer membrane lipoprotein [Spirosoma endbachense]
MKNKLCFLALTVVGIGLSSCDKGFQEVNINPVQPTVVDPIYLFSNAEFSTTISSQTIIYEEAIVQQVLTPYNGVNEGGNHNVDVRANTMINWNYLYSGTGNGNNGPIKLLADVMNQTKANTARSNLYNMARIWKAYVFLILVDTYGDIPYKQAGQAYLSGVNLPVYDNQQEIYTDLLNEVDQATTALDATKTIETGDIFFKGNIAQWKRFGNSLLLRMAMRLTKVDAQKAQTLVQKAFQNGVMQSNDDNVKIQFTSIFNSPLSNLWNGTEKANFYLAQPFIDYLKTTKDPRLKVIATKYAEPSKNPDATTEDNTPANQVGIPVGYDDGSIKTAPGFPGTVGSGGWKYSQLNRRTLGKVDAVQYYITHAQTQLLLAEAAQRGWIQGKASDFYQAGVRAHMSQITDPAYPITAADMDAYLTANPFDATNALNQINSQYWVASLLNGPEAWANWRRSGYPALAPNPYPGKTIKGDFIHRLTYPSNERSVNVTNYNLAVARQGADDLDTRLFWDK